jgi:hypothetical protein
MSSQSGFSGIFCPACDKANTPTQLVRQMAAKQEGMLLKCPACSRTYSYAQLMSPTNPSPPRKVKLEFTEKQPAGFLTLPLWLHPDAAEALRQKFPSNLLTTLSSAVTSLADPDSVLIEGPYAREMAAIGVKTGRQVLGMAKELKELREQVAAAKLREDTLRQFFSGMGLAMPQPVSQPGQPASPSAPSADNLAPPLDAAGNVLAPPHARFAELRDDGSGLLVPADGAEQAGPSQFTFPTGAAPTADGRPGFVVGNLR